MTPSSSSHCTVSISLYDLLSQYTFKSAEYQPKLDDTLARGRAAWDAGKTFRPWRQKDDGGSRT
jgi:hypothetical protein